MFLKVISLSVRQLSQKIACCGWLMTWVWYKGRTNYQKLTSDPHRSSSACRRLSQLWIIISAFSHRWIISAAVPGVPYGHNFCKLHAEDLSLVSGQVLQLLLYSYRGGLSAFQLFLLFHFVSASFFSYSLKFLLQRGSLYKGKCFRNNNFRKGFCHQNVVSDRSMVSGIVWAS